MLSLSLTIQLAFQQHLHLLHLEELPCIENELQQLVERQVTATCKCWGDGVSPSRRYSCTYSDDRCRCSRVSTSCVSKTCCWGEVSQRSFAGLATSVWLVGELMSLSACWPATTQTILDARERPKISNFVGFLSKHCWMAECTELVYGWGCAWSGLHYIRSDLIFWENKGTSPIPLPETLPFSSFLLAVTGVVNIVTIELKFVDDFFSVKLCLCQW